MHGRCLHPAMFSFRSTLSRILLVLLFAGALSAEHDGDMRYWQTLGLNCYENENWRFKLAAQTRLYDDANFLGAYLVMPSVEYKLHPNVDLATTYLYEGIRNSASDDFTMLHIFWVHANWKWKLADDLSFAMRNVLGWRSFECAALEDYWITRNKFALSYAVDGPWRLVGVGVNTEVFYNFKEGIVCENRAVPLSLTFKLTEKAKLSLYGMIQSVNYPAANGWEHATIFGQTVTYKF